jgi:LysM repeat protein
VIVDASRRLVVTAVVAGAVGLVACGGDNATTNTTTTPLPTVPRGVDSVVETTSTVPVQYIVKAGESLTSIAKKFGVTVAALVAFNELADPNHIEEGQQLKIPPPTTTTVPP